MRKVFEAIGRPRNYQLSPEVGQDPESKQEEERVGEKGHEVAPPSLPQKGRGEEDKQKAEGFQEWVGSLQTLECALCPQRYHHRRLRLRLRR